MLRYAEAEAVEELIEITQAHVDGCLYHGEVSLDFVERFVAEGGRVAVPYDAECRFGRLAASLIVSGARDRARRRARSLMRAHLTLGRDPMFTCAPYQTRSARFR